MEIKKSCNRLINLENKRVYQPADKIKAGEEIDFDMQEILIGNEIVVTDGYLFGKKYQVAVKSTGASLVSIDDLASMELFADVIINHAPGINRSIYKIQSYSQLLTGLDYAIIRKPFLKPLKERNQDLKYKAFISLGGSDLYGFTENLLDLLTAVNMFEELHILCSSSFETSLLARLKKKQFGNPKIKMHFNLDAEALVALLDDSTHAFVSAS
ncbi:MAG: hypothetical protein ABIQ00_09930, partial [Chitinophagaceae bacterium]